jgi:AraC family ethanolamine operon transcriptional activator
VTVRHNQMSPGRYLAEIDSVSLPNLRFSLTSYRTAITSQGTPPKATYALALPVSGTEGVYFNHHPLQRIEVGLVRSGDEFHLLRPDGFRCVMAFPSAALIDRLSDARYGRAFSELVRGGRNLPADQDALAACARRFARICEDAQLGRGPLCAGTAAIGRIELIERKLVDALLSIVRPPAPLHGWSARERTVRRAWEIVEDGAGDEMTVSDLCVRLAVPVRSLDDAFQACLGVTPKRFIIALRLNKVRSCLNRPRDHTTVTEIATRFGFYHFGHFSAQYHRLFGEPPSRTLSRARS